MLNLSVQPSAYKAVGSEERLGIVIRATDEMHDCFVALEEHCRKILQADGIEQVDTLWCSSAREDDFGKHYERNSTLQVQERQTSGILTMNKRKHLMISKLLVSMLCVKFEGCT